MILFSHLLVASQPHIQTREDLLFSRGWSDPGQRASGDCEESAVLETGRQRDHLSGCWHTWCQIINPSASPPSTPCCHHTPSIMSWSPLSWSPLDQVPHYHQRLKGKGLGTLTGIFPKKHSPPVCYILNRNIFFLIMEILAKLPRGLRVLIWLHLFYSIMKALCTWSAGIFQMFIGKCVLWK